MKKIFDYLLSSLYLLYFFISLAVFHLVQVIAWNVFGRKAHKKSVDALNGFLTYGLCITGSWATYRNLGEIPENRPLIFVSNHQSMFDITGIVWFLRKYHPIFVSKMELSKGIPSISYNLRKSGAALIDRKDGRQALTEIARLGKLIQQEKSSAVIFPEGTRTTSGQMKRFSAGGLATLIKKAPDAFIVPIAIKGTGKFNPTKGIFPLSGFTRITYTALPGYEMDSRSPEEMVAMLQHDIQAALDVQN
ncbi:MAG: 1-acyl-sn-glycerol-3-phosphate acyltransferase [Cyclobacteriaceae bacterium]|nr:1-acyl-sn-glycerol-3-phosphate acyltransferase [Cyclobacteriaceae bacterium]